LDAGKAAVPGEAYYLLAYNSTWVTTSCIAPDRTKAHPGRPITMKAVTLNMNSDYTYSAIGFEADIYAGASLDKLADTGIDSDEDGYFSLSFDKLGTYYIVARSKSTGMGEATAIVDVGHPKVEATKQSIIVNGAAVKAEIYNIDGSNYFKLRDLAYLLNGTGSQFSVGYDEAGKAFTAVTGEAYKPQGTELTAGVGNPASAAVVDRSLIVNGTALALTAFNIGGNDFFRLRDLGAVLGFDVEYDEAAGAVKITAKAAARAPKEKGEAVGKVYFFAVTDLDICTDAAGKPIVYYPIPIYKDDTIADAITTLHEKACGDGSAWAYTKDETYGYYLTKFWGKDTGSMTYGGGGIWTDFSTKKHADVAAPVADGMIIYLNNHTGSSYMRTGYFDKQYVEL
jgi:hypothetical protein